MRSDWGSNFVVVARQSSGCGGMVVVVGEGKGGVVVSGTRRGAGPGVPSVANSPLGGTRVVNTGSPCIFARPTTGGCSVTPPFRPFFVR